MGVYTLEIVCRSFGIHSIVVLILLFFIHFEYVVNRTLFLQLRMVLVAYKSRKHVAGMHSRTQQVFTRFLVFSNSVVVACIV